MSFVGEGAKLPLSGAPDFALAEPSIANVLAVQVLRERAPADRASRNMFAFSILYLFLLFAVLLVERGWGGLMA